MLPPKQCMDNALTKAAFCRKKPGPSLPVIADPRGQQKPSGNPPFPYPCCNIVLARMSWRLLTTSAPADKTKYTHLEHIELVHRQSRTQNILKAM